MEIANVQQIVLLTGNPTLLGKRLAFGTMAVSAGIVGNLHMAAILTDLGVAAKLRSTATFDCLHRPQNRNG